MAKRLQLRVPHRLDRADALARVGALADYYRQKYGADVAWDGDRGTVTAAYGPLSVDVRFEVGDQDIHVEGPDPGLLLRGKASAYVEAKVARYLDPATPLDSLPRT